MTKTSITLQDLRRRIYIKAKAEPLHRFWEMYVHVIKMEILKEAYRLVRANKGASGIDEQSFESIEAGGIDSFLHDLQDSLMNGTYRPQPIEKWRYQKQMEKCEHLVYLP